MLQDFGDGGAFPEISVAQYPLNMGKESKESSSNAIAVQLDAKGKVKYDVLTRQDHSKDKVRYLNLELLSCIKLILPLICYLLRYSGQLLLRLYTVSVQYN